MICPNCGRQLPDGAMCPCGGTQRLLSSNPALHALKSVWSSPAFLAMVILNTVALALSLISLFSTGSVDYGVYYYYVEDGGYLVGRVLGILLGSVPSILMTIGLWIHYSTCRQIQSGNISTAGLTLWRVAQIILACLCGLLILMLFILMIFANPFSSRYSNAFYDLPFGSFYGEALVLVFLILILVCVLMLCYEIAYAKTLGRLRRTALSGVPDNRISGFVIGMHWFLGCGSGLMGLINLFDMDTFLGGVSSCCSAASMILLAILFSRYKKRMALVMYPPVQPVYPAGYGGAPNAYQAPGVPQSYQVPQSYPVQPPQPPQAPVTQAPQSYPPQAAAPQSAAPAQEVQSPVVPNAPQPESSVQGPEAPVSQPEAAQPETVQQDAAQPPEDGNE